MLYIGSHVSFKKDTGLLGSLKEALSYRATTFMFYTGAPQNTARYKIDKNQTKEALEQMKKEGINKDKIIVHAPYIVNLANRQEEDKYEFSIRFLQEEIERCEQLEMKYLVLHPGSHVGCGKEQGIKNIVEALNRILKTSTVTILLETMAGKGTEIGSTFEEIKEIIDGVEKKEKIGVCLDTCHLNDAGYDVKNISQLLDDFDRIVGLSYVKCVHVNDSKNERSAHKDRHENIGLGSIGFDAILSIIYEKRLEDIPKILETPYIDRLYPPYLEEIDMIKKKQFNENLIETIKENASHS